MLLKGVSPSHKIEFARSIITKDGHIISAYLGGIEKDLGKAKAKEIASKLAGQEPQFGTVCEISENAETGEKTIKAASKKRSLLVSNHSFLSFIFKNLLIFMPT